MTLRKSCNPNRPINTTAEPHEINSLLTDSKQYNPNNIQKACPYFTRRYITAEAKNYITYEDKGADAQDPQTFNYINANDANDKGTIKIPPKFLGREGTTYIYQGFHDPTAAPKQSYSPRFLWMWAYRNPSGSLKDPSDPRGAPEPSAFYKCAVNISEVINANPDRPEHLITNHVAKTAASLI